MRAGAAVTVTVNGAALSGAQLAADFTKSTAGGVDTYTAKGNAFTGTETIAVSATLTDTAGNTSGAGTLTLNPVDTTAPAAPLITTTAPAQDNASTIDIVGTAEAGSTVALYNNGTLVKTTAADGSGNWQVTGIGLTSGSDYSFTAKATDAAGNTSVASNALTFHDNQTAPAVTSVTAPAGDDGPGTLVALTVNFSEVVTVDTSGGTPTLKLSNGATASYASGSGTAALVFNYTVGALGSGQDSADLGTAASNALVLNGGTIKDAAGNAAVLSGASNVNPAGTLQIDTTAPTVSISVNPANLTASNNTATVTFTFSAAPTAFSLADTTATGGTLKQPAADRTNGLDGGVCREQQCSNDNGFGGSNSRKLSGWCGKSGCRRKQRELLYRYQSEFVGQSERRELDRSGKLEFRDSTLKLGKRSDRSVRIDTLHDHGSSTASVMVNSLTISDPNATLLDEGALTILISLVDERWLSSGVEWRNSLGRKRRRLHAEFYGDRRQPGARDQLYRHCGRDIDSGRRGDDCWWRKHHNDRRRCA